MANGQDVPRLSAVVERQRRELARVRADHATTVVIAMARGVLVERHGWSSAEAAGQLAAMAAAAGLPEAELAAAVLAQESLAQEPLLRRSPEARSQPGRCQRSKRKGRRRRRKSGSRPVRRPGRRTTRRLWRRPTGRRTVPSSSGPSPRSSVPVRGDRGRRVAARRGRRARACSARTDSTAPSRAAGVACRPSSTALSSG